MTETPLSFTSQSTEISSLGSDHNISHNSPQFNKYVPLSGTSVGRIIEFI